MKKFLYFLLFVFITIILIGTLIGNNIITKGYIIDDIIDEELNILHISDFHSNGNTSDVEKILYISKSTNPDLVVLTGDIIDGFDNYNSTLDFVEELSKLAPTYYSRGNNDNQGGLYKQFVSDLGKIGVVVLRNEYSDITINNQEIRIIGLNDNANNDLFGINYKNKEVYNNVLKEAVDENKYNIVLAHRPHYFNTFVRNDVNLALTGHTHGGQIRVPFVNKGVIALDQGFFPDYDYGEFTKDDTTMIINSGTTNSVMLPRLFNPKEVVLITVK